MSVEELVYKLRTHSDPYQTMVEAADKLEELAAALRVAQGNTDAAIEDYNEAKAALAEKDKEIAALHSLVRQAKGWVADHAWQWHEKADQTLTRNAGGNNAE